MDSNIDSEIKEVSFGDALAELKKGKTVTRKHWNEPSKFIMLIKGSSGLAAHHGYGFGEYLNEPSFLDAIFIHEKNGTLTPWTSPHTDLLAVDWIVR